jgi:hypothetical protein
MTEDEAPNVGSFQLPKSTERRKWAIATHDHPRSDQDESREDILQRILDCKKEDGCRAMIAVKGYFGESRVPR